MTWNTRSLPKHPGVYLVTDKEVFTNAPTRYKVMPLYWTGTKWNCLDSGNHGFCYPVLAWCSMPHAYKETP